MKTPRAALDCRWIVRAKQPPASADIIWTCLAVASPLRVMGITLISPTVGARGCRLRPLRVMDVTMIPPTVAMARAGRQRNRARA